MAEQHRRPVRRRRSKRKSPAARFIQHYLPSICLVTLAVFCVVVVIMTVQSINDSIQNPPTDPIQLGSDPNSEPTDPPLSDEAQAIVLKADSMAMGYDYLGAIELLKTIPEFETIPEIVDLIAAYTEEDEQLVVYSDMSRITHIFFHSLIVDCNRAFDGDEDHDGYNLYMTTISEFELILENMYDKGFVLVSPYDVAYEVIDADGTAHFEYGEIRLPEGKKPFLMSQDDVNYYSYMIGTGSGKNETPIFVDTNGDGFAHKIVIGEDGYPTCLYMDENGNVTEGDYDLVPVLEKFIQAHPDFSYHGARAMLGVTGYEGVFGYRTKPSYEAAMGTEAYQKEVAEAKAVAQCLKDHGWLIVSHSYGHPAYGNIAASTVRTDSDKWEATVQPIVGETDIILYPHGSDINGVGRYTNNNEKFVALYEDGYRYFFNVDANIYWSQLGENYYRGGRRNLDGYRMWHTPNKVKDLFDAHSILDPLRPTPVPEL